MFKTLIDRFTSGRDPSRLPLILEYVTSQSVLQNTANPSGAAGGLGLGEPKFNIDETAFTGSWGRPQRVRHTPTFHLTPTNIFIKDGPALRTTALITLSNWFISQNNASYVTSTLWPMIELDLNYVSTYWNQATFDLWEELYGQSFFTTAVQHRALREGVALATTLGQSGSSISNWASAADGVLCFLQVRMLLLAAEPIADLTQVVLELHLLFDYCQHLRRTLRARCEHAPWLHSHLLF